MLVVEELMLRITMPKVYVYNDGHTTKLSQSAPACICNPNEDGMLPTLFNAEDRIRMWNVGWLVVPRHL